MLHDIAADHAVVGLGGAGLRRQIPDAGIVHARHDLLDTPLLVDLLDRILFTLATTVIEQAVGLEFIHQRLHHILMPDDGVPLEMVSALVEMLILHDELLPLVGLPVAPVFKQALRRLLDDMLPRQTVLHFPRRELAIGEIREPLIPFLDARVPGLVDSYLEVRPLHRPHRAGDALPRHQDRHAVDQRIDGGVGSPGHQRPAVLQLLVDLGARIGEARPRDQRCLLRVVDGEARLGPVDHLALAIYNKPGAHLPGEVVVIFVAVPDVVEVMEFL